MDQPNYLPEVRTQYEHYPYPLVDPELERTRLYMPVLEAFDRLNYYCYSGRRDFSQPFRALIAGGGTGHAAIALAEQLREYPAEVVYLDLSESAMAIAQARASLRGLTNIHWIRDSLLNIPTLGLGEFDYINCSGVLHHLADPEHGLRILVDALGANGAMGLMLYAKYGRTAVYQMQEALRLLNRGEGDAQTRVESAKIMLRNLPASNWFHQSPPDIIDDARSGDVGIYDLLLHSQDRAYSIPELYGLVENAGLQILQLFSDDKALANDLYNPLHYIKDPPLAERVKLLSMREQQALAELLNGKIIKHTFYAAKSAPPLPNAADLECVPVLGFDVANARAQICDRIRRSDAVVVMGQKSIGLSIVLPKTPHMEAIVQEIDGQATLHDIFRKVIDANADRPTPPDWQTLAVEFEALFRRLNLYNWLFLRHKSSSPVKYLDELQARVEPVSALASALSRRPAPSVPRALTA